MLIRDGLEYTPLTSGSESYESIRIRIVENNKNKYVFGQPGYSKKAFIEELRNDIEQL